MDAIFEPKAEVISYQCQVRQGTSMAEFDKYYTPALQGMTHYHEECLIVQDPKSHMPCGQHTSNTTQFVLIIAWIALPLKFIHGHDSREPRTETTALAPSTDSTRNALLSKIPNLTCPTTNTLQTRRRLVLIIARIALAAEIYPWP